jgi:AcrR family transcriptional regulator
MDARQKRTNQKLTEVILRLSAQRLPSEITVSEVTVAAGINRSTFYQHASSPTDLLENVLRTELDEIRSRYLDAARSPVDAAALRNVVVAVLEHVDAHSEIYARGLGVSSASSSLHPLLSRHFEQSVIDLIAAHSIDVPQPGGDQKIDTRFLNESAARFIADGTVGAMEVWLRSPAPRSTTDFLRAYRVFMPSWWPIGDDDTATPVISVAEPATA